MLRVAALAGVGALLLAGGCATAEIGDPNGDDPGGSDAAPGGPDAPAGTPDATPVPDAAPAPDAAPCVEGDINVVSPDGTCYMYFSTTVTWPVALSACGALGDTAHLATSTSPAENAVLAAIPAGVDDVWMGGTDAETEMTWVWITGESMLGYDNWREGEPNDAGGEDCMIMELDTGGLWDDRGCDNTYGYFCERE